MDDKLPIIWKNLNEMVIGFIGLVPNIVIGIIVLILFTLLGKAVKSVVKKIIFKRKENLGIVVSRLTCWLVNLLGLFLALIIIIPTFKMGDFIAGLGIGSVAIGFAFKDILQNFLSGILILLTEPFSVGDEIIVKDNNFEGTVIRIETRATQIITYDGRLVIIPNTDLYTGSVIVNTAFPTRRSTYTIGIHVDEDIKKATQIILDTLSKVPGVLDQPKPDVILSELDEYTVNLTVRWWTDSKRSDITKTQSDVLSELYEALNSAGVKLPFPTQNVLLYDQNKES